VPSANSPSPSGGSNSASPSLAPVKLSVAYSNITLDNLSLWYAFEKGIAKANGLDLDIVSVNGGSQTMAGLLAGTYPIAQLGGSEVMSAAAGGEDLVIFGTNTPVFPYVLEARAEIKTPADLKGKKVGISNAGGSSDIATRVALRAMGLDPDKDVVIVALGSHAQRTAALQAGTIGAGVDHPPNTVDDEKLGMHPIYDLAAKKLPTAQTTITTKRSWLTANKATAQRYVDTIVKSMSAVRKDKDGTVAILKKYYKSNDDAAMVVAYDFYVNEVLAPLPYPSVDQFASAQAELSKTNRNLVGFDVSKIIDTSFVKSAEDRKLNE
jgi:NitT/TauT family transport system substrate-binding protein